jgi:hypothetical protein
MEYSEIDTQGGLTPDEVRWHGGALPSPLLRMRHLCTFQSVWICRLAAFSFIILMVDGLLVIGSTLAAIFYQGHAGIVILAASLALMLSLCVSWMLFGSQFRCPSCLETPLYIRPFGRGEKSGNRAGCCRVRVAASILSHSSFRCFCCRETVVVRTRRR